MPPHVQCCRPNDTTRLAAETNECGIVRLPSESRAKQLNLAGTPRRMVSARRPARSFINRRGRRSLPSAIHADTVFALVYTVRRFMALRGVLGRAPVFAGAQEATLARLVASARLRHLRRGDFLWRTGEIPESLTIIRTGVVKVVKAMPKGRSSICGLFGAPDSVGAAAVIRRIAYPADAQVITQAATVVEIALGGFLDALEREPHMALGCTRAVQDKIVALHAKISILSAGTIELRLAQLLINLYDRFGDDLDDNTQYVPIMLSRKELAQLVSSTFETVIRIMTRWERGEVVTTTPHGFIINCRAELDRLINTPLATCEPGELPD